MNKAENLIGQLKAYSVRSWSYTMRPVTDTPCRNGVILIPAHNAERTRQGCAYC